MVMPEAQVVAGINVEQAKTTPFGQWVLTQMQGADPHMQQMVAQTGFDPRRDVRELLVATPGGADPKAGIALARGTFDIARISAAAKLAGATVETYRGATVVTDPKKMGSFGFPDSTTVVAGAPELVRAAIDRRTRTTSSVSPALATKVNQLSTTQDAWGITLVPPSTLHGARQLPQQQQQLDILQKVLQASGGVKFGATIAFAGEALTPTAQDATSMAQVIQFLANMAATQSNGDPAAASLVKALTVNTQGQTVKIAMNLPQSQFEQLVQPRQHIGRKKVAR
jgi:hypothetical protein